jgi:WD40 repeat protein
VAVLALVGLTVGLLYGAWLNQAYQSESQARSEAQAARQAEEAQRQKAEEALGLAEAAKQGEEEQRKRVEHALGETERAKQGEQEQREKAERIGYVHSLLLADLALRENNLPLALERLGECKEKRRNWEWRYLKAQCNPELMSFPGQEVAFSPDGRRAATADKEGVIRVYDLRTGEALVIKGPMPLGMPQFVPDGKSIAATVLSNPPNELVLFDPQTGQAGRTIRSPIPISDFQFLHDGSRLAIGRRDVRILDARSGEQALALKGPQLERPVFSPDGKLMAVHAVASVRLYDTTTGKETKTFPLGGLPASRVLTFTPDSTRLVVLPGIPNVEIVDLGLDVGDVSVFDVQTGQGLLALRPGRTAWARLSPDGTRIAALEGSLAGEVKLRVYDIRSGRELSTVPMSKRPSRLGFSPDGTRIVATGSNFQPDTVARVFNTWTGAEVLTIPSPTLITAARFTPDGARIATVGQDNVVRIYDARGHPAPDIPRTGPVVNFDQNTVFSPDGTQLACGADGTVWIFDGSTGRPVRTIRPDGAPQGAPAPLCRFSPDGERLAFRVPDGTVRVYNARTGEQVLVLKAPAALLSPTFSPKGTQFAVPDARYRMRAGPCGSSISGLGTSCSHSGVRSSFPG